MPKHKPLESIDRSYTPEECAFLRAVERYKKTGLLPGEAGPSRKPRPWPTWTEVLAIVRHLGYRKVAAEGSPEGNEDE